MPPHWGQNLIRFFNVTFIVLTAIAKFGVEVLGWHSWNCVVWCVYERESERVGGGREGEGEKKREREKERRRERGEKKRENVQK